MRFIKPGNVECWQTCQGHHRWLWGGVGAKNLKERAFPLGRQDMTAKDEAGLASTRTGKRGKWPELPRLGLWLSIQYALEVEEP